MLLQRANIFPLLCHLPTSSNRQSFRLHANPISSITLTKLPTRGAPTCSTSASGVESSRPQLTHKALEDEDEGPHQELLERRELEDLPEQWRRSKIAWLCKELPLYNHSTFTRLLNAQRKWITQEDATYILLHCLRLRNNSSAFRVYNWMLRQHWFKFNFPLATKLADCLGKDRKVSKCREVFDDITVRGYVPSESTFHVLVVAYLSAPVEGSLEEACTVYNRMIQTGRYWPQMSLHNALLRAIVSRPGVSARHFLKQAEFIFDNLTSSRFEIHKDIYAGLIWLHSYQDVVDRERIEVLREKMRADGFEESRDVLVSIMRACSKDGDAEEGKRAWDKILELGDVIPSQALIYQMEIYAKIGEPKMALELFMNRNAYGVSPNVVSYQKIIEVMSKGKEVEIVESLMNELVESGLKPLTPSFIALMDMYLNLEMHDEVERTFSQCVSKCNPTRNVYDIYLDSLVRNNRIDKAEEILNEMRTNEDIGTSPRSCNIILRGFLSSGDHTKVEQVWNYMIQKKYNMEPAFLEKVQYILSLKKKAVLKPINLKLDKEQREILMGLLLGGVTIERDAQRKRHSILFEFNEKSNVHHVLRTHIHGKFSEWLCSHENSNVDENELPYSFSTITHASFGFFADQFWPKGRLAVPRLLHRWLSERVLAYWYMYAGFCTPSGDVMLKIRAEDEEDAERVVRWFLTKSLNCRTKRKGRMLWIGLQNHNATQFWKMVEPYVLDTIKPALNPNSQGEMKGMDSGSGTDANDKV